MLLEFVYFTNVWKLAKNQTGVNMYSPNYSPSIEQVGIGRITCFLGVLLPKIEKVLKD